MTEFMVKFTASEMNGFLLNQINLGYEQRLEQITYHHFCHISIRPV